jgi:Uma2 family endonuclease
MIATSQEIMVRNKGDFERLPEDGLWEVVDGRAILLPANDYSHQKVSAALFKQFDRALASLGYGEVLATMNVHIPVEGGGFSQFQNRVPDLIVFKQRPQKSFDVGQPPELVIEILATRRGNVERTEKLDDYARAGIGEYWIVNPFDRVIEVYALRNGEYTLKQTASQGAFSPEAFPGL